MYSFTTLEIAGYRGEPVPNTFSRQAEDTQHLAVVLPGWGYTASMPVLYYPGLLLLQRGADLLRVEYAYSKRPGFAALAEEERRRWLMADVTAALEAGLAQRRYERITLVGKSIGTLAMGHLLAADPRLREARPVWLTPLLQNEWLRERIREGGQQGIFVIGTADPYYDPALLAEAVQATQSRQVVIEGADHSIEIAGSVGRTLEAMVQVMQALEAFVA